MTAPAVEAAPLVLPDRWDLGADPAKVAAAAAGWRALGTALTRVRAEIGLRVGGLRGREGWTGPAADAYWQHAVRADALLGDQAATVDAVAGHLDFAAELLRRAQGSLDAGLDWLGSVTAVSRPAPGQVRVAVPPGDPERALFALRLAVAQADQVRADLDAQLAIVAAALTVTAAQLESTGARAGAERAKARQELPDLLPALPPRSAGAGPAVVGGGHVTIGGTAGDDEITVERTPAGLAVTVNGDRTVYGAGTALTVAAGGGADDIVLERNIAGTAVTVLGGDGYDEIRSHQPGESGETPATTGPPGARFLVGGAGDDALEGGAGDDRLSGGDGQDYLDGFRGQDHLDGGAGHDVQYGGSGRDLLRGGTGQDYQDGGADADDLVGGRGDDVLSGGRGDDRLSAGSGRDVLYAGAGRDQLTGGSGRDRGYLQPGEDTADVDRTETVTIDPAAGSGIQVTGTPEFQERVAADLDTLRSSPTGLAMLHALDDQPTGTREVVVAVPRPIIVRSPVPVPPTDTAGPVRTVAPAPRPGGSVGPVPGPGDGPDVVISELPGSEENNGYAYATIPPGIGYQAQPYRRKPPIGVLFHEMAHVYDFTHGTTEPGTYEGDDETDAGVNRSERQAVGLPIDDESDPGGPEAIDPEHPLTYTENGLRAEMGMEPRRHYNGPGPI